MIIDNDAGRSGAPICKRWEDRLGFPISYVHEPRRGIPRARNTALAVAAPGTDWIAFIDDDEVPAPHWADRLLWGQRTFDADVVAGAVVPHFETPPHSWVSRGRFFQQPRHHTGTQLGHAYTNNVMFRAALVRELDLRFDEQLSYGGEDMHFFRRISLAGYKIVWIDDALVVDWIGPERVNARWLIQRRYLNGVSDAVIARKLSGGAAANLALAVAAVRRCLTGGIVLAVGRVAPYHARVAAKRRVAYAIGLLEVLLAGPGPEPLTLAAHDPPILTRQDTPGQVVRRALSSLLLQLTERGEEGE